MVEMRWVRGAFKGDAVAENNHGESFRLQYRCQVKKPKKNPKLFEHVWEIVWSEWIDVPTVKE